MYTFQRRKTMILPMILNSHHKEIAIKADAKFITPKQNNSLKTNSALNVLTTSISQTENKTPRTLM